MIYNLANVADRQDFKQYCNQLYLIGKSKGCVVELTKKRHTRSDSQSDYLHVCLRYFASEFGYTEDEVKQTIYKQLVNADIYKDKRKNRRGEIVEYIRSSTSLNTKEMSLSIERFRNYSATQGLYIPEPSEHEALLEAKKQIEQYAEYL